jgi:TolB-like protein
VSSYSLEGRSSRDANASAFARNGVSRRRANALTAPAASADFDRQLDDVFKIQREVSEAQLG